MENLKEILGIDFDKEIEKDPEVAEHLEAAALVEAMKYEDPLAKPDAPVLDTDFKNFFIIAGMPKVGKDKLQKLNDKLFKVLAKRGVDFVDADSIEIPFEGEKSVGMAIVRTRTAQQARIASSTLDGYALDKKHTFAAATFDEYDRITKVNDTFKLPKSADADDLRSFRGEVNHDQFLLKVGNQVTVRECLLTKTSKKDDLNETSKVLFDENSPYAAQTPGQTFFSPNGTYLVVVEEDKIKLLGGSEFEPVRDLVHFGVDSATISPCEKYICSFSSYPQVGQGKYIVWRIDNGEVLREFEADEHAEETSDLFQWSHDGNFIAKMITDHICIYSLNSQNTTEDKDLPPMSLLWNDQKEKATSIRVKGIETFMWSPTANHMMVQFRLGDNPQVKFIDCPSRRDLIEPRVLLNAKNVRHFWSKDGRFLTLQIKTQVKSSFKNEISIFDCHNGFAIGVTPVGHEIKTIDVSENARMIVATRKQAGIKEAMVDYSEQCYLDIFDIETSSAGVVTFNHIATSAGLDLVNHLSWAQNGSLFVAGSSKGHSADSTGTWAIYSLQETATKGKFHLHKVNTIKREFATKLHWDPLYRFIMVANCEKGFMASKNRGFKIFNILGEELFSEDNTSYFHLEWRKRPETDLDAAGNKDFKKKYTKQYFKALNSQEKESKTQKRAAEKVQDEDSKSKFFDMWKPLNQKYLDGQAKRDELIKAGGYELDTEEQWEETMVAYKNM